MMTIPKKYRDYWALFEAATGGNSAERFYEAFHFDDSEAVANELAELVLAGRKQATASLFWAYEAQGKPLPETGCLSVVTDWQGHPLCIIETRQVDVVPYQQVSAEFAAHEGEGDGSLEFWRDAHWPYFSRECERIGRQPSEDMPVVCERFRVVHQ